MSSISASVPPYKLFVWDSGTTGKDPHLDGIRTLAIVEYNSSDDYVTRFNTAVGPRDVTVVEHYDPRAPSFATAWKKFASFVETFSDGNDPLLVSHNASFDVSFLKAELARECMSLPSNWRFVCSLQLARTLNIESNSHSQSDLADHYGVVPDREHHAATDVMTLRDILIAMSEEYCILPLLYRDAQKPSFFDRVPELQSDEKREARFFVTLTGRKYHAKGCRWLSRSCIPKTTPPPGLEPCSTCRPQLVSQENRSSSPIFRETSRTGIVSTTSSYRQESGKYFITKTGQKYHVDGCKWLSRSKIPKDCPPQGYRPCRVCLPGGAPLGAGSSFVEREVEEPCSSEVYVAPKAFYITNTGVKYHVDGCKWLSRSKIPRDSPPVGYDPCRVCLPNGVPRESTRSVLASQRNSSGSSSFSRAPPNTGTYYITTTGTRYHVDGCKWLSRSKIPRDAPPSGYAPCRVCLPNGTTPLGTAEESQDRVRESSLHSKSENSRCRNEDSQDSGSVPSNSRQARFYTTRTGRKFHIGTCTHLRNSKIATDSPPPEFEACAVCLPYGVDPVHLAHGEGKAVEENITKLAKFPSSCETTEIRTPERSKKPIPGNKLGEEKESKGSPRSAFDFAVTF